jgi:hypothetical protein
VVNFPLAVHIWCALVVTLDDHSLEASHAIPPTCSLFTSNIVWTNIKSSIVVINKTCLLFVHVAGSEIVIHATKKKTHKTLNTKTYTANNKNNNIKNCMLFKVLSSVNICERDPTVQACKHAHEGRVHQYQLFELQVTFYHTWCVNCFPILTHEHEKWNNKRWETIWMQTTLANLLMNQGESFWNAVYKHLMTFYRLGLSTIKWLYFIQNILYMLWSIYEGR